MARKCPVCGSRRWRKDAVTGSAVCGEGHVLQGVRSENLVTENTGHALQKRTLKRIKVIKDKNDSKRNPLYLHGNEAEVLRLQCLQLLLRHQVQALQKLWAIPDVFELIVRDLWAYQLVISPIPDISTPSGPDTSPPNVDEAPPNPPPSIFLQPDTANAGREDINFDDDNKSDGGSEMSSSEDEITNIDSKDDDSDSGSSSGGVDPDSELLAMISDDTDEDDDDLIPTPQDKNPDIGDSARAWNRRKRRLRASDTVICLVLGLWILRVPFAHRDIEEMINTNQIPYVEFGRTTLIPSEMAKRLNRDVKTSLSPPLGPTPLSLFRGTQKFARILTLRFGQNIPEINVPPVAWSIVSSLGGTATTHFQVLAILKQIDANMSLNNSIVDTYVRRRRNSDSGATVPVNMTREYRDVIMPELSIASAWVILMKLVYGLDGLERLALLKNDPAIGMPRGDQWIAELEARVTSGALKGVKSEMEQQRFDIMELNDMDRYLDRCEEVLLKHRDIGSSNTLTIFPLHPNTHAAPKPSSANSWDAFHAQAALTPITLAGPLHTSTRNNALPLMPGERLRSYDARDVTGELPQDTEIVLAAAAQVVGVQPIDVAEIVQVFERRIEALRPRRGGLLAASPAAKRLQSRPGLRESHSFG